MWLCAMHDCGKATPAFQAVDTKGAAQVKAAGMIGQAEFSSATLHRYATVSIHQLHNDLSDDHDPFALLGW